MINIFTKNKPSADKVINPSIDEAFQCAFRETLVSFCNKEPKTVANLRSAIEKSEYEQIRIILIRLNKYNFDTLNNIKVVLYLTTRI